MTYKLARDSVSDHFQLALQLPVKKGYFLNPEDALVSPFSNWNEIQGELAYGGGGELRTRIAASPKFCAGYSSAALCVNHFAPIHARPDLFSFFGHSGFSYARFEKVLSTGVRGGKPNLDFVLKNEEVVLGVESKFLEILEPKLPNWKKPADRTGNLAKYRSHSASAWFGSGFPEVLDFYIHQDKPYYLDVSQLIKHTMGLIHCGRSEGKKPVLVYLFWTPENWAQFPEYGQHRAELNDFAVRIAPFIRFHYASYPTMWAQFQNHPTFSSHFLAVQKRYQLSL